MAATSILSIFGECTRERALDADAERLLADGERLAHAVALALDADALEHLHALAAALDHPEVDVHGVAGLELRHRHAAAGLDVADDGAHWTDSFRSEVAVPSVLERRATGSPAASVRALGLAAPPAIDARPWSPDSSTSGTVPAAERRRPRVVRVLDQALERGRERLLARATRRRPARPRGSRADGVDDGHRRDLAAAEHERPERQRLGGDVVVHAVVEALVAAAQQHDVRAGGELAGVGVVEPPPAGVEHHDAPRRRARSSSGAPERALERRHATSTRISMPAPPPYGVSSTMRCLQRRVVAQVVEPQRAAGRPARSATWRSSTSHENQLGNSVKTSIASVAADGRVVRRSSCDAERAARHVDARHDARRRTAGASSRRRPAPACRARRRPRTAATPPRRALAWRRPRSRPGRTGDRRPSSGGGTASPGTSSGVPRSASAASRSSTPSSVHDRALVVAGAGGAMRRARRPRAAVVPAAKSHHPHGPVDAEGAVDAVRPPDRADAHALGAPRARALLRRSRPASSRRSAHAAGADDGAQRAHDAPALADHLAAIVLGDRAPRARRASSRSSSAPRPGRARRRAARTR